MALLFNLANKLADKYGDRVDSFAQGMTNAIPRFGAEGELRRLHDQWARGAQLHRPYWGPEARYEWIATNGNGSNAQLACSWEYTFVRRDHLGLYTADGVTSWAAWWQAGPTGLTTDEPRKPAKPQDWLLEADLADANNPERWTITAL